VFGFRPLLRGTAGASSQDELGMDDELELPDFSPAAMGGGSMPMEGFGADFGFGEESESELELEDSGTFNRRVKEGPERRLARMVEINEERAAKILRSWASSEAA
jgi:flagellar M-ring protein FliF